jgi:Protein of unknown function (DUF3108)
MAGRQRALRPARRAAALALVAAVSGAHLWLMDRGAEFGWGDAPGRAGVAPRAIEVAFVKDLDVAAAVPAPAPPAAPPATARPRTLKPPKAASAAEPAPPEPPASAPEPIPPAPEVIAQVPQTPPAADTLPASAPASASMAAPASSPAPAEVAGVPASAPLAVGAAASGPANFEWPPSTRLTYRLNGNYRGELQGSASVEWRVSGARYQVELQAIVGVSFAPLMVRQIRSDGEITADGLAPQRFDAEQRVAFTTRRWSIRFEPERIVPGDGAPSPTVPGVQDEASQFVQLTWLFTTRPDLLQVGRTVELPLVLRRRVDRWAYDVVAEQDLVLPFGTVRTLHVKPRRPARSSDMAPEMWVAPSLQNLPVRILIRQDESSFVDLVLDRVPRQAERPDPAASAPTPR